MIISGFAVFLLSFALYGWTSKVALYVFALYCVREILNYGLRKIAMQL